MKSKVLCLASAILLGFLTVAVADADGGPPCTKIKARGDFSNYDFQSPCEKYPGFDWCWVGAPVKGSIKGTWDGHGQWDWVIFDVSEFELPTWEGGAYYQKNYDIFITKHGEIHVESVWVADNRTAGGGVSVIIGGTGIYEDATGLIASWTLDPNGLLWEIKGDICGPYIPIESDDDSDSDSDSDDD